MATYTWNDGTTSGFTYSYTLPWPAVGDFNNVRALVGDVNGTPIAYLADETIVEVLSNHGGDLYTAAAECAEMCSARCLQIHQEIQQGHRLKIRNFEPAKAFEAFLKLAEILRNKSTNLAPSYGVLAGSIAPPCRKPNPYGAY